MKVIKLVNKTPLRNDKGDWLVFVQVLIGNKYEYGAIVCDTLVKALEIKKNQILDIEKVKFSRRTNIQ